MGIFDFLSRLGFEFLTVAKKITVVFVLGLVWVLLVTPYLSGFQILIQYYLNLSIYKIFPETFFIFASSILSLALSFKILIWIFDVQVLNDHAEAKLKA